MVQHQNMNQLDVVYVEVGIKDFIKRLENTGSMGFLTFNLNTLFVLRDANYLDILRLFTKIEGCKVEIFKATGQKSHVLSSLDLKLSMYILAMSDFDYNKVYYNNAYNSLDKKRYLPSFGKVRYHT